MNSNSRKSLEQLLDLINERLNTLQEENRMPYHIEKDIILELVRNLYTEILQLPVLPEVRNIIENQSDTHNSVTIEKNGDRPYPIIVNTTTEENTNIIDEEVRSKEIYTEHQEQHSNTHEQVTKELIPDQPVILTEITSNTSIPKDEQPQTEDNTPQQNEQPVEEVAEEVVEEVKEKPKYAFQTNAGIKGDHKEAREIRDARRAKEDARRKSKKSFSMPKLDENNRLDELYNKAVYFFQNPTFPINNPIEKKNKENPPIPETSALSHHNVSKTELTLKDETEITTNEHSDSFTDENNHRTDKGNAETTEFAEIPEIIENITATEVVESSAMTDTVNKGIVTDAAEHRDPIKPIESAETTDSPDTSLTLTDLIDQTASAENSRDIISESHTHASTENIHPKSETKKLTPTPTTIHQKKKNHPDSIHDLFSIQQQNQMTLGGKISGNQLGSLKSSISLNEKLLFTRSLFGGDSTTYNNTITHLDSIKNESELRTCFTQFCEKYHWNIENDSVSIFEDILFKRFS